MNNQSKNKNVTNHKLTREEVEKWIENTCPLLRDKALKAWKEEEDW